MPFLAINISVVLFNQLDYSLEKSCEIDTRKPFAIKSKFKTEMFRFPRSTSARKLRSDRSVKLLYTPFINSDTLIPNPFASTSNIGKQTFFFPFSISEMCPRSIPNWCAIST